MSTSLTPDRSDDTATPPANRLSLTQILASALAAVTTTAALSYVGKAGTIIGAALASVVTVLGNHLYTESIRRTRLKVIARADAARGADPGRPPGPGSGLGDGGSPRGRILHLGSRKRLVLTVVAVFVAILLALTAFELLAHRTLSEVVRGQTGSGTTIGVTPGPAASSTSTTSSPSSTSSSTTTTTTTTSTSGTTTPTTTDPSTSASTAPTTQTSTTAPTTSTSPGTTASTASTTATPSAAAPLAPSATGTG